MSSDITKVFTSTVRALSDSSVPRKPPSTSSVNTEKAASNPDTFAACASRLHLELVTVRRHMDHAGELSRALATADATRQRMYHEVAVEVNAALEQCGKLLQQLWRRCGGEADTGQGSRHRKAVCRSLEEFLKTLQRARDEQVATYCRRVELAGRLGENPPSSYRKSTGNGAGWLFGASDARNAEALSSDSLSEAELKQLELENAEVYLQFLAERNEIQRLGSQISEIGRLQAMVTESLIEQAEAAQRIGEQVVGSTELIREANEQLRQSMEKTKDPSYCRFLRLPGILALSRTKFTYVAEKSHQTVVTGIQPTGYPHIGNYFGVIKPCARLQGEANVERFFLIIADLHALTTHTPENNLTQSTLQLASALISCGIDPVSTYDDASCKGKVILFPQSAVVGHCTLSWILSSLCTVNRLGHLPQWREKSEAKDEASCSVGLFTYPILQAADVLLYAADFVPVGADQVTHLELARDLVRLIQTQWPGLRGLLKQPEVRLTETPKIYNLREPTKKMSKSMGAEAGTIWLTDPPDSIKLKVARAQTDSLRQLTYDPSARPGVANLMQIFAAAKAIPVEEAVEHLVKLSKVELKDSVADALVEELTPIQDRLAQLNNSTLVEDALSAGTRLANRVASQNMQKIKEVIGLSSY